MSVPEGQKVVPERGSRYDQEFSQLQVGREEAEGPACSINFDSVLDTGSQIVLIWHDLAQAVGAHINTSRVVELEGAYGVVSRTARWGALNISLCRLAMWNSKFTHMSLPMPPSNFYSDDLSNEMPCVASQTFPPEMLRHPCSIPLISHTGSTSPHHRQSQTPKMHSTTFNAIPSYITRMAAILLLLFIVS